MENNPPQESKGSKWVKLLLKIIITVFCLWYVSGKIDFTRTRSALTNTNWIFLLPALLLFIFSKLLAAIRLNIYFNNSGLQLSARQNINLYWLGMFYNLFLPGSIGGDAYKVILLKKKYNAPYKKTTSAVLLDRFSGLLGLGLILGVYGFLVLENSYYAIAIAAAAILGVIIAYIMVQRWLKDFISSFSPTLLLGIAVQAVQVLCVYLIMASLRIPLHFTEYIFIFLVSSVVSVLPFTIGGLGIRELVFLEGSRLFGLSQETSVVISLLFYLLTLLTSAAGSYFIFRAPLAKK